MRNFEFVKRFKNTSVFILAMFYMMLSIGIGIKTHYCHGSISSITYVTVSPECECGEGDADMSCCQTEDRYFQFDEVSIVQQYHPVDFQIHHAILAPDALVIEPEVIVLSEQDFNQVVHESPPIYLLNASFVFYG